MSFFSFSWLSAFDIKLKEGRKQSILERIRRFMNFESQLEILDIDFSKPWIRTLFLQKKYLALTILNQLQFRLFSSIMPILFGYLVVFKRLDFLISVLAIQIVLRILSHILFRYHPIYELNIRESIVVRAFEQLMKVDPEFHSTRSSGQIISKINRGSQAVWTVSELGLSDILGVFISLTSIALSIYFISPLVSVALVIMFVVMVVWSFLGFRLRSLVHLPVRIKAEDKSTAVNIESMQQVLYIRSSSSTEDQINEMRERAREKMVNQAIAWRFAAWIITPQQMVYPIFTMGVLIILWNSNIEPALLIGSLLSIIGFGSSLYDVGRVLDKAIQSFEDATDLFDFINNFGKQTYPVLEDDVIT